MCLSSNSTDSCILTEFLEKYPIYAMTDALAWYPYQLNGAVGFGPPTTEAVENLSPKISDYTGVLFDQGIISNETLTTLIGKNGVVDSEFQFGGAMPTSWYQGDADDIYTHTVWDNVTYWTLSL